MLHSIGKAVLDYRLYPLHAGHEKALKQILLHTALFLDDLGHFEFGDVGKVRLQQLVVRDGF